MRRSALFLVATLAIAAFGPAARLAAQASPADGHGLRFGLSIGHVQARDELLAPLRWAGPGATLDLGWEMARLRDQHRVTLTLPFAVVENRYGHQGFILGARLDYAYRHATRWTVAGGPFSLGGRLRYDLHDGYFESWDQEHGYWFTTYTLAPAASWSGAPGSDLEPVSVSFDIPLLALVSRPERHRVNKIDDLTKVGFHVFGTQRDLGLATVPSYLALRTRLEYRRAWGTGLDLTYDLEYATYGSPERVSVLTNRIGFGHRF